MAPAANVNETELVLKAGGGDLDAFSRLVELHQERAIRVAYSFLGNADDARDAAQEAFVKAWSAITGFRAESRFGTWLYRIVANQCKDRLRKKKMSGMLSFLRLGGENEIQAEPAYEGPGPAQAMMNRELEKDLHDAAAALPLQQGVVFKLRYLEGMALEDIAATLGLTTGAVKAHLWQACQKMKDKLERHKTWEDEK